MKRVNELEREISGLRFFADALKERDSEYAPEAYAQVSLAEQRLAHELESCNQDASLAWRGAVQSALESGDMKRAKGIMVYLKFCEGYPNLLAEVGEWVK